MNLSFTIPGAPRTKKNHGYRTKQGHQMPSKAFQNWNRITQYHLRIVARESVPFVRRVNCEAIFYRDALRGDAVGYYQALADALEESGIVLNDALIVQWDGSRLLKDENNPRIEVALREV